MTEFLVGGYGADMGGTGSGIGRARSHTDGSFEYLGAVAEAPSPSWLLAVDDSVYAALEGTSELAKFTRSDAGITEAWRVPSGGASPCHLAYDSGAVLVANYTDGAVAVHRPGADPQILPGTGSGPLPAQVGRDLDGGRRPWHRPCVATGAAPSST